MVIDSFTGEHSFLSNFYPVEIELDGQIYPTLEHAFQAAKTSNKYERERIRLMTTPGQAKRAGRHVMMDKGWDKSKKWVMRTLLIKKFEHPDLRQQLLATGEKELIEGNNWGDTYWGICDGVGQNILGKLLMDIRSFIKLEKAHDEAR